jgi:hypothetical protein
MVKLAILKFRDLINPNILNDEDMIGFQGDSEYVNGDGELVCGTWTFIDKGFDVREDDWNLDSEILEDVLWGNLTHYLVKNDNGTVCEIRLQYNRR